MKEFLDGPEPPDLAALGLESPRYRLTLVRSEGQAPTILEFGASRQKEGATEVACRRDGRDLLWVDSRAETGLGKAPVRWRSIAVYPFDSWDIDSASFSAGGTEVSLTRDGAGWKLDGGGEVDPSSVSSRLSALAELRATDFDLIEPGSGEWGRVAVALGALAQDGGPQRVTFTFYRPLTDSGRAVVRVSSRATVMGVDASAAETILGGLEALRSAPTPAPSPPSP